MFSKVPLLSSDSGREYRIIDFYVHIEEVTDVMISVRPYDEYKLPESFKTKCRENIEQSLQELSK